MIVVHIESGLGNQMLSYCEYLVLKKLHPNEDVYIENIVYDIPQCNEVIRQWNGYELDRIFGIKAPNIRQLFNEKQWKCIMDFLLESEFWDKNWNYPVYITRALQNEGLNICNIRGNFEQKHSSRNFNMRKKYVPNLRERLLDTSFGDWFKRNYRMLRQKHFLKKESSRSKMFYQGSDSIFTGQWLGLKYRDSGFEEIEREARESFVFPDFVNAKDIEIARILNSTNSVAIHARRGDMLGCNGYCYKYGYFQRAVKYIKKHVDNPVFVFFCDPDSVQWCKENQRIFALDFSKDVVYFVDWNKDKDSFRDLQLMGHCKHAIITNSSFGWWGSFFIENPQKITISPKQEISVNTTIHL